MAVYEHTVLVGYTVAYEGSRRFFKKREDAVDYARENILRTIRVKAAEYGITGEPNIELLIEDDRVGAGNTGLIYAIKLTATATQSEEAR